MKTPNPPSAVWQEIQQFRQPWLWGLLISVDLLVVTVFSQGLYQQLVLGKPWGDRPMSNAGLIAAALVAFALPLGTTAFLWWGRMITEVQPDEVVVRFPPFYTRRVAGTEITKCEVRTYRPIVEFGGWGVRRGRGGSMALNVSGNRGVQLELAGGKKLLIGSDKAETLARVIQEQLRRRA